MDLNHNKSPKTAEIDKNKDRNRISSFKTVSYRAQPFLYSQSPSYYFTNKITMQTDLFLYSAFVQDLQVMASMNLSYSVKQNCQIYERNMHLAQVRLEIKLQIQQQRQNN